ncbi:deoxyhypusine synthase [Cryptococcus depauperatus]
MSLDAHSNVLTPSQELPENAVDVKGPDFSKPIDLDALLKGYETIGFQATGLARAIQIVEEMRKRRTSIDEPLTLFIGYTSNLMSSGLREILCFLAKNKLVDCFVTTAGGVEEDFVKCLGKTVLGDFHLDGASLRKRGLNRIGNLLVPNSNYCAFEDWVVPILDKMVEEQENDGVRWSPSSIIRRLGKEIDNEESVYYWCYKNDIPVFCPALTDGSLGDMIYFHTYKSSPLQLSIDIVVDIRRLNDMSLKSKKAGMIVLGGGVCKHQIANAMLFRNGADYAVYINTGQEYDGSDSGARPDEAVSWGKIRAGAESVKVYAEATLVFPLVVAATFGKAHWSKCAYSHPPTSPIPSKEKPAAAGGGLSMEHLSAPVFVPKGPIDNVSSQAQTPSTDPTATTWPLMSSTDVPQQQAYSETEPTYAPTSHNAQAMPALDPSAIDQTTSAMYLPPRQPLDHHLYTAPLPHITNVHPAHPHSFFVSDDLRRMVQSRQEAIYMGANGGSAPGLPQELGAYHSLVPLPLNQRQGSTPPSRTYGLPSPVYRATSEVDGNVYCLRRIEGFKLVNQAAFGAVDPWRKMRHPNIVGLKEVFTTKGFGDNSLVLVYDYHPLATSIAEEHLAPAPPSSSTTPQKKRTIISERTLWSYLVQICNALKAIHSSGLAVRNLDASKILLTGRNRVRLGGLGIYDVLAYDNQTPISAFQQEDLLSLGKLILTLTCDVWQPNVPFALALEHISRQYSSDMKDIVIYLTNIPPIAMESQAGKSIDEVIKMMGPRILNELDAMQNYTDVLENELGAEVENGRIVRLLTKLGFINERAEFELDPRWSDTGDRYILKLFRDYVFHSISVEGQPVLDLSHVLTCLNKLDAGLDERIMLVSRDDQSCLVVSYKEIKHCIEAAFNELRNAGNLMRVHR